MSILHTYPHPLRPGWVKEGNVSGFLWRGLSRNGDTLEALEPVGPDCGQVGLGGALFLLLDEAGPDLDKVLLFPDVDDVVAGLVGTVLGHVTSAGGVNPRIFSRHYLQIKMPGF